MEHNEEYYNPYNVEPYDPSALAPQPEAYNDNHLPYPPRTSFRNPSVVAAPFPSNNSKWDALVPFSLYILIFFEETGLWDTAKATCALRYTY